MTASPAAGADRAAVQRRTLAVLSAGVALGGLGVTVGITVGGLLAREVAGSDAAAGLGQTASVLGAALVAVPLAGVSNRRGRRVGLALGYGVAVLGAVVVVAAAAESSLPLLLAGLFLFGAATSSGLQARYAAADLAEPEHRGRALSLVVWATTIGSVVGPNLAEPGDVLGGALGLPDLGGAFVLSVAAFAVVALGALLLLRPDPLLLARRLAVGAGPAGPPPRTGAGAALRAVWATPGGRLGVTAVVVSHAVMVGLMVMTPVHMGAGHAHADGTTLRVIGLVISVHVAGMYLFSPAVGWLADRVGRSATVAVGGTLLLGAGLVAGTAPPGAALQLGTGLFLLGLGWSCGLVAGSTLVTESVPADRAGRDRPAHGPGCGGRRSGGRAAARGRRVRPGRRGLRRLRGPARGGLGRVAGRPGPRLTPGPPAAVGTVIGVRLQEFWSRMEGLFGSMRSQSVYRDHVFGALGGRSAAEAIEAGVPVRTVWLEICKEYDVPPKDR